MIFDRLSIFSWRSSIHLLKSAAAWSGPCVLCLAEAGSDRVCEACSRSLPRPGAACPRCALPLPAAQACGSCLAHPPAFDATVAAFEYRFPIDRLVQRFKFAGDLAIGRWLGECLAQAVAIERRPDILVAAPIGRARLRERGFNQALELARAVARAHRLPIDPGLVAKVCDTPPQQGLTRSERRANLRDAFRVRGSISGAHIAIVDDVMTTGATAEAMARALRGAGAGRVVAWVLARTPEPGH